MISDAMIRPSVARRALVASAIGIAAGVLAVLRFERITWHPSDFGMIWFGARALLHGANPYGLVGPGMQYEFPWTVNYPATSFVLALPFAPFSEVVATFLFVAISAALLAYGVTEKGWGRLPIFLSWPFILAALVGQWSPIVSAAFLLPAVGWVVVAKPNLGLAVLASTSSSRLLKIAAIGGVAVTAVAFALFPSWPRAWLTVVASQHHFFAPITRIGGFAILLALLRWRRPEARLIVALACVPQTNSWYEAVPVMLAALTFREALLLSLISLLGYIVPPYVMTARNEVEFNSQMGSLMVAICYLPATIMILRRKNEGELPPWVLVLRRLFKKGNIQNVAV